MAKDQEIVVPVIDLANFPAELKKLAAASTELGCFRVSNHGMPMSLLAKMKEAARSLFEIPADVKLRNVIHNLEDGGYRPPTFSPKSPLYESFGIYNAASPTDVHSFCSTLDASPQQCKIITEYFEKLHEVTIDIASKVGESLGLNGCSFKDWSCQARLISYKFAFQEDVGRIGVPAHTDSSFLTVLQEDECVGGLEIMDANANFIDMDPLPGTLFVNIGDIGKVWSNGRLQSVKHRVVCKKAMPRISIALFLLAPKHGSIETEPAFIDTDHPKLYKTFIYNVYRKQRNTFDFRTGEILHAFKTDDDRSNDDV
ncbi:hypothetical protein IEQ34_006486 [Dendrobium chrysotoxum]|uniref:Fe2OG dioxygenase domain-containing protein n=1 Tax=Dendrobium chrysotoxum TaxID=161865 RepID=A0AAV7HG09_DENCH|nr:hypothetical protein IEQ34_006486 [Dendrobium chrysotoxum]